jgi:hypothetical protein
MDRDEKLQWTLSKDRRLVTVKLSNPKLDLTEEHLSSFIHALEHIRAKMQPEVPAPKSKAYKADLEKTLTTAQ